MSLLLAFVLSAVAVPPAAQPHPAPGVDSAAEATTPEVLALPVLYRRVSSAVVVVEGLDRHFKVKAQGSGVVIGRGTVVTSGHVVEKAVIVRVRQGDMTWNTSRIRRHRTQDLAWLDGVDIDATALEIRSSPTLEVGEHVYALGAPEGFELTLSEGIVSSLRPCGDARLVQTSAPISAGSSGGALLDDRGRLVGVVTARAVRGQNLNFALPAEWARDAGQATATTIECSLARPARHRAPVEAVPAGR